MNALYMVVGTLITLGVLVTFHEFGHFWVARRCGVKVIRFSVGFGMPLVRWRDRKGTEFVIAAIPLGGYVHMLGDQEDDVPEQMLSQTFNHKTILQRVAIVAAGPIANFILALVFFWFLAMLGSQQIKPVVGVVDDGSLAAKAGLRSGEEIVAVDGRPTLGWNAVNLQLVRRLGESGTLAIATKPANGQSEITHTINLQDWLKGAEEPDPIGALGLHPWRPALTPVLAELEPGPAKNAGLQAGDRILTIDDQPVSDWQNVVDWVRARPDAKTVLLIDRQGVQQSITVTLTAKGEGKNRFGYMGAGVKSPEIPADMVREVRYGPVDALAEGASRTWAMSVLTLETVKKMLIGELSVKNLSGAITIAKVAGASAQSGFKDFLNFLACLSISLGVFNLLPIPVLDGGRLLFYLIEWARGRPLSERVQGWGMQIGVSLVVGVMLLALINDVSRL